MSEGVVAIPCAAFWYVAGVMSSGLAFFVLLVRAAAKISKEQAGQAGGQK